MFARENFMSYRTLITLVGIKAQFLDYLVDIGFSPENSRVRNKRSPEDTILEVTGPEVRFYLILSFYSIKVMFLLLESTCSTFKPFYLST